MGKVNTGLAKLFVLLQIEACPRQKRAALRIVFSRLYPGCGSFTFNGLRRRHYSLVAT